MRAVCFLGVVVALAACGGGRAASTAPPGPPIAAEPAPTLGPVADECGALVAGLDALIACTPDRARAADLRAWRARAALDVAGASHPDVSAEDAAATGELCRRAAIAVADARARCR